ncbi:molybdopterin-dependent oxidoreductase [Shewanella sp. D64]|uniref:molybdopterin dinucleotide binding domain-containing protein n=1 Tax=unclassified Shewanella TaxID=196818 RepID=UPI0022BA1F13|nr:MULTISPECIES: molybdopterin dinucleotide binding domain-containing protein [unclassified Shewanella]MEC4727154.1 molybdopterin-dependent oxidoreductase [Shewanella sp. D64]MEC4739229.1 molybdopterin-dependent oxidoreductase [Shewanella sp. E94]WBJ95569.1 molybdopterin-dependent oxidoreductase [Shewanella sp. MTB7]
MDRRQFINQAGMLSLLGLTASGCSNKVQPPLAPIPNNKFGNPLPPEFTILSDGNIQKTPGIRTAYSRCFACYNMCGIRARIDEASDTLLKVGGNPYCENNSGSPMPLVTQVKESYRQLSGEAGQKNRATTCAKGACSVNSVDDERRVTQVLKRAGKRGDNNWVSIPYEQALQEILNGGDLFGEGDVDGLKAIHQLDKPAREGHPEFGSAANRLFATFCEEDTLRGALYSRFMKQAWGTTNLGTKHSYCGASLGSGMALAINPGMESWLNDIDWDHAQYAIFLGTSPGSSGYSLNRVGRGLADARVNRQFKYVCVDPLLRTTVANNTEGSWLAIKPGRDSAFLFGLIQIILANNWHNTSFLAIPSSDVATAKGEVNHSNATHLVIDQASHPRHGQFATAAEFGLGKDEALVVVKGQLQLATKANQAELLVNGTFIDKRGNRINLVSSLALLKREADRTSLADYASYSGISVQAMQTTAYDFTHHGRRACIVTSTGANSSDSTMIGWLCGLLNTLIASHDAKGGALYANGAIWGYEGNYDLSTVENGVDLTGVIDACRDGGYESSTEYKDKIANGQNPYPAENVWHELVPFYNAAEMLTSQANADPYSAKAFINWRSNVLYSAASISQAVEDSLKDPARVPLSIAIDCHLNETNRYADYFIPDRSMYEEYAASRMWGAFKLGVVAGAPLVSPRTVKDKRGRHVCMEQFLIDIAMEMQLPGFGKEAIPTADGRRIDLLEFDDWHACYLANVAAQCTNLPLVSKEDRLWAGLDYAMKPLTPRLTVTEATQVESLLSRGGYYEDSEKYSGEFINGGGGKFLQLYHAGVTQLKHAYSGKPYPGTPIFHQHIFWNGDTWEQHWPSSTYPLLFSSYKPAVRSPYSVAYDRTDEMSPENYIYMHPETALTLDLEDRSRVTIRSGNGRPASGTLQLTEGVTQGSISASFGFGHNRGFGGDDRVIDGVILPGLVGRAGGLEVNRLIPHDPTRQGEASMLIDYWAGDNCRHGVPVRVDKA